MKCKRHYICNLKCIPARVLDSSDILLCKKCSEDTVTEKLEPPLKGEPTEVKPACRGSSSRFAAGSSKEDSEALINKTRKSTLSYKDVLVRGTERVQTKARQVPDKKRGAEDKVMPDLPGIYIFVDDSNIWIEAKKLQSKVKNFKTGEDHRIRIDVGRLADVVAGTRKIVKGTLYGSEPPPIDTIWEKIRQKGWIVKTDERSKLTGKEKKVDTRLVAEMTALAVRTPVEERSTIILVTGDADALPAIEEAITEERWMVEVYRWKQAISKDLKKYAKEQSNRVQIKHLDHFLNRVSFTHMRFDISNEYLRRLVNAYGVVFTMEHNAFRNDVPTGHWFNQVESIAQWPFQYYWFKKQKRKQTDHLVIVFRPDKVAKKEFDVAQFLEHIQIDTAEDCEQKYRLPLTLNVRPFRQFIAEEFKREDSELESINAALEQVGIYNNDDVHDGCENESVYESDPAKDFTTYLRQSRSQPFKQKYSEFCPLKFNCKYGTGCQYKHTDEEKTYFKGRKQGKGNPLRKVKQCTKANCTKPNECDYAHGPEDAWCLNCVQGGHFTKDCTKKSCS